MISESGSVRINAWGPLRLYLYNYVAPEIATASLIYISMFWAMITNLVANAIGLFFFAPSSGYYHLALIFCIFMTALYATVIVLIGREKFQNVALGKILLQIIICSLGFTSCAIFFPSIFSLSDDAGILAKLAVYALVYPFFLAPLLSFILAHIFSNILRPFRSK